MSCAIGDLVYVPRFSCVFPLSSNQTHHQSVTLRQRVLTANISGGECGNLCTMIDHLTNVDVSSLSIYIYVRLTMVHMMMR